MMNKTYRTYREFIEGKQFRQTAFGKSIEPSEVHSLLFPFQQDVVTWAVRKGRCAIFLDTGLGKTLCQLEFARLMGEKALIVAPLSVARQTIREGRKIGLEVQYARDQSEAEGIICITNYERTERFDFSQFGTVILDECFVSDTLIDTAEGMKRIADIQVGDQVYSATGLQEVRAVRKQYKNSLALTSIQGRDIISSVNHPFFTRRGWVKAKDLERGDYVIYTTEAMRMVQETADRKTDQSGESILRHILLSEMEDEPTRDISKDTFAGSSGQTRQEKERMVQSRQSQGPQRIGAHSSTQSYDKSGVPQEVIRNIEKDRTQAQRFGRQWTANATPPTDAPRCSGGGLDRGICAKLGETQERIPNSLQNRHSQSQTDDSNRGRWTLSCSAKKAGARCKKGNQVAGARVDSVTIYKSNNPIFTRYRDETNRVALYDLELIGHPSFSVNGILVHNSSILKAVSGHYRRKLTEACRDIPYRLCCTATPAPNDYIELGNHADFLGICSRSEMLAQFFINANKEHTYYVNGTAYRKKGSNKAGQEWRLKHHAESPFFQWMASWAIMMIKPSDLGYSDDRFTLPPLNVETHFVEANYRPDDRLFFTHIRGVRELAKIRRHTLDARLERLESLVNGAGDQWIVWVGLNEESEAAVDRLAGAVEVCGDDSVDDKAQIFEDFQDGKHRVLVTKPTIGGFGMNFQNAHKMAFLGLSHSWEQYYQCVRREWRYLQEQPVDVHIVISDIEDGVYHNIMRKDRQARRLREQMVEQLAHFERRELEMVAPLEEKYKPEIRFQLPPFLT